MDILIPIGIASLGAVAIVGVYWAAKRTQAKENGEVPPTLMQALARVIRPQDGGPGKPRPPA